MLLRSLHIASRQLFYLLAISIIVGLLGLIAAVWLSDEVAKRKDELASWASQKTGYPVTIEQAGLYWFDLIPKLEVRQVAVMQKDGEAPILTASQVYLTLDLLQTLTQGEPVLADASIRQARLAVERDQNGQFQLTGLQAGRRTAPRTTTLPEVLRWFSWLKQLELSQIQLTYTDIPNPSLSGSYLLQQLELAFARQQWQAIADIALPQQIGSNLRLSAKLEVDDNFAIQAWQGSFNTEDMSLSPLLSDINLDGVQIESGLVSASVNASQSQTGELNADMELIVSDALLSSDKSEEEFDQVALDRLQGHFRFASEQQNWELTGDSLLLQMAGETWPATRFEVNKTADGVVSASADYLRLSDLTSIALLLNTAPDWLVTTKPAGDVEKLAVRYQLGQGPQKVHAQVGAMAMLPWQDYPGANDLSFTLDWQQDQGQLSLNSHQTTIYADTWLKDAVFLDSITGTISWRRQENNWHVLAEELSVWNKDLNLALNGRINHQNETTDTDLRLALQDINVNQWRAYVPERILPDDFEKWSRGAFREGVIREGLIELSGNPAAFPFDKEPEQGKFDMHLEVENTRLHYAEGWPDLMQVNGQISGKGNDLLIKSQSGSIAGFAFKDVTTTISNLVRHKPILRVDGLLSGTTSDALAFLQNSPLKKRFASVADWMEATGRSDIKLELMVPLVDPNATQATGYVSFVDSQLTTQAVPGLQVTAINGQLEFDNHGVKAQAIQAQALNEPVTIDVIPEDALTRVDISGRSTTASLRNMWPALIPDFADGDSAYLTQVLISEPEQGEFDVAVTIRSDLRGISIDAPEPLGKLASQRKPLMIRIETDTQPIYHLSLDKWLNASLTEREEKLTGQIMLGGEQSRANGDGLTLGGYIDSLNLDDWLDWQTRQQSAEGGPPLVDTVQLRLGQLLLAEQAVNDLAINASQSSGQWQVQLDSSQIKGDITLPKAISNETPLAVRLDHLRLNLSEDSSDEPERKAELWPALRLDIAEFELNKMQLGSLNLRANRTENSWAIEAASLRSPVLQASLTGSWTQSSVVDRSQFDIVASSDDLKALLAYYGYQEVVEARQVQLNSQLNWRGNPAQFSLDTMQGQLDLSVGRGSLIEVEPGAAGRIFGLLSIAAIPRRLALDFSDLFGKGFDFSAITGHFTFAGGIARTDDLIMRGDSALIEVAGPVYLVEKTYDQVVKVTPEVSSTLPIAGAVAGGPVGLGVGTAILLVDKIAGTLFDREIVNLISYQYALTGPWDSPKLNVVTPTPTQGPSIP